MAFFTIPIVPTNGGSFFNLNEYQFASVSISPTKILLVYMQTSPNAMYAQVINLSGALTPVPGTASIINSSVLGIKPGIRVSMLSPTKAFVSFRNIDSLGAESVFGQILDIDVNDNILQGPVSSALFSAHAEYGFNAVSTTSAIYCVMDGLLTSLTRAFNTWHVPIAGNVIGTPISIKTETASDNTDGFSVLPVGAGSYIAFILNVATLYDSTNVQQRIITDINVSFPYSMLLNTNKVLAAGKDGTYHIIDITNNVTGPSTIFTTPSVNLNLISMLKINNETVFIAAIDEQPDTLLGIYSRQQTYIFRNVGPGLAVLNNNNPITIGTVNLITPRSKKPSRHTQLHLIDNNHIVLISLQNTNPSTILLDIFEQL